MIHSCDDIFWLYVGFPKRIAFSVRILILLVSGWYVFKVGGRIGYCLIRHLRTSRIVL